MSTTTSPGVDNGVNVEALLGAREALTVAPEAARFQWRARCEWVNGTHSRTTVHDFSGLGAEHTHRQSFVVDADHPEVFASEDDGGHPRRDGPRRPRPAASPPAWPRWPPTAACSCARSPPSLEGDMDIQGILGIDPDVRNGYSGIRVRYEIDADADRAELEAIVAQSQKRSAVFDIVTNPTNVTVELA